MTTRAGAPIVVGVDGSPESRLALSLAVRMAAERARRLRVVHAFVWPLLRAPVGPSPAGPPDAGLRNDADRLVAQAVAQARDANPEVEVSGDVVTGSPASVLLAEAADAVMVVVGDRGLGGFTGLLLGSVAVQLAAHAPSPVLIAKGDVARDRDILVGVDGSPAGSLALGFAFEEASLRGVGLTALHAYTHPTSTGPGDMLPLVYDEQVFEAEEAEVLAEALAGWRDTFPDVTVRRLLVRDRPARALVHAAERAAMVVVGSRGRGGFAGLLLGSVSQAVLHHASCPVAIIR